MKSKAIFNWSSGKDSALALYKILKTNDYDVITLLTSVNKHYDRISMHGVRTELLEEQAKSLKIPLYKMEIPEAPTMEIYETIMRSTLSNFKDKGISISIFGDIFLEDLRNYREDKLKELGFKGVFPLWKIDTKELIYDFLNLGFKTIVTCVNERYLDKSFVGRIIDHQFINDLPKNVDPCGENGEFHTFTFDGPIFSKPINFEIGEIVHRKYERPKSDNSNKTCNTSSDDVNLNYGFWYIDLLKKN
ncbi:MULTISPECIES: Dph6-related ATP pyrophosphatase [Flavobacterium]|uniref:Diphthine--ammonia ligase n=2 Tax=Flavobacterium TaxID=237 RepID=A0AA94F130_9FLAO|nr:MULTISPECIES: diphthine--ammonia ligase [Flavobacterium]OXA76234.1 ATP-binding protein [Flavobacterium columnare] [Flavobacterium columnare NBRC 100251 = ATCC 23463]AMA50644.1 ATP-binding protein [Flavobacterium covae]AND65571.1 ATP-binding protein [Flavobacterium covae]MCH4830959.1 diphthine--ammonia ligase [Flavobacterium columnare]MCH4833100.1 diphthine--ammonia ligase [Flavobacterium columnare]